MIQIESITVSKTNTEPINNMSKDVSLITFN